jgi:phage terminase small subunit
MGILKNSRHEAFALALSKGETATAAYKLAGYKADRKNAARLTTKDDIAARVSELQTAVAEQHIITQVEILTELRKIGFSRISRAVRWGGRRVQLVDSSQLDDDTVAAVSEVSESAEGALKIKLHDKKSALELAAKIQGFFDHDDVKQQTQINVIVSQREREGRL